MFVWTVINGQAKKIEDESDDNKSMMINRQTTDKNNTKFLYSFYLYCMITGLQEYQLYLHCLFMGVQEVCCFSKVCAYTL